jgi:hypothetical protein
MTFDPSEFLRLARSLATKSDLDEAEARTVVSRCCYALFLRAREALTAERLVTPTSSGRDHALVTRALQQANPFAGAVLGILRDQRNRSDYDLAATVDARLAREAVSLAQAASDEL